MALKRHILELLKDLVIAVLVCTLLLLAMAALPRETIREHQWLSQVLQPLSPLLGLSQAELTYVQTELPALNAAEPTCISVKNSAGRSTAMWDFAALDSAFETYGGLLGQAMDTADPFLSVSVLELFDALSGPSVSFRYEGLLPGSLLAWWLDAHMEQNAPAAHLCVLAPKEGSLRLFLVGDGIFAADTQVTSDQLVTLLEQSKPDGSLFAFEADSHLDPLCILPGDMAPMPSGFVSNPITASYIDTLANDLGFNPYNETRYQDEDGTIYFSELNCALQITPNGRILLTSTARDRFAAQGSSPEALVELARQMIHDAAIPGAARLYLTGFQQEDRETVITFDYFYNGIPLALSGGPAATVTFTGSSVSRLELQLIRFTRAEQLLYPLPPAQAAALVPTGGTLTLQYCITPEQLLTLGWKPPER